MTREEAIEFIHDIQTDAVYSILPEEKEALDMAISALSTDVRPNIHGHWKVGFGNTWCSCSECGGNGLTNWSYCPWCGADIRGESDE